MEIQEGLIPTILGTAVTAAGSILKKRKTHPMIAAGMVGFGLAHVVLGTIDLIQHRDSR